jgi:hypothetical protein
LERKKINGRDDRELNKNEVREEMNGQHLDKEHETKQVGKQARNIYMTRGRRINKRKKAIVLFWLISFYLQIKPFRTVRLL